MLALTNSHYEASGCVLHDLQSMKEGFRDAVEGGIAEVQARYDEAEYHCLARYHGEGVPNFSYAAQVMVCQSTCVAHVPGHVHRIIQHYVNITDVRLGTQNFSIDMYNNWPWVTCGCGGDCNDFCLAAVESELVQCHPLLHVLYTTGEAVSS